MAVPVTLPTQHPSEIHQWPSQGMLVFAISVAWRVLCPDQLDQLPPMVLLAVGGLLAVVTGMGLILATTASFPRAQAYPRHALVVGLALCPLLPAVLLMVIPWMMVPVVTASLPAVTGTWDALGAALVCGVGSQDLWFMLLCLLLFVSVRVHPHRLSWRAAHMPPSRGAWSSRIPRAPPRWCAI